MGPSLFFPGLPLNENTRRTIAQKIRALFAGSLSGAWYDPSDLSTMFQTSLGQDPVTTTGQSVGLILDKRLGLQLGAEAIPTPNFETSAGWAFAAGASIAAGRLIFAAVASGTGAAISSIPAPTINTGYVVTLNVTAISGNCRVIYGGQITANFNTTGLKTFRFVATGAAATFTVQSQAAGLNAEFSSVSVKPLAGNHAFQATSASRPVFRDVGGLRYLEFDGVDDYLRATFTIAQPIDRISALQLPVAADGTDKYIYAGATVSAAAILVHQLTNQKFLGYSGAGPGIESVSAVGADRIVTTERYSGATSRLAVNTTYGATADAGTTVPDGLTIGASQVPSVFANMHLYQVIMRGSTTALTDTQITLLRKVCYAAAGLPFPGYEETEVSRMFSSAPTATGAWYDPSDLSTMFQTSTGTLPVTGTGEPVGLILDKRFGLSTGPELVANGASPFASTTGWNTYFDGTLSIVDGKFLLTSGASDYAFATTTITTEVDKWYDVRCQVIEGTSAFNYLNIGTTNGGAENGQDVAAVSGEMRVIFKATATSTNIAFFNDTGAGITASFYDVSVKELPGNHALQGTSASRPIFRDVGGLQYLEFDGVDDHLRSTFTIAQPIDRISALQQVTWTLGEHIFGAATSANASLLYQNNTTPNVMMFAGADGPTAGVPVGGNRVVTELYNGASSRLAVNAAAYITGNPGPGVSGGITLGAAWTGGSAANFFLHQLIMRGSATAMTDGQISACRALCAIKSGVTL